MIHTARRQFLIGTGVILGLAMAGARVSLAQDRRRLTIRQNADIQNLDPAYRVGQAEANIMLCIFPSLVRFKEGDTWGWELNCAKKIEQTTPTTIDFTLRDGMLWSNGAGEITAEDVKFSYERIADPANNSPYKDDWAALDRVDVKSKTEGTIVLKQPSAPLWLSTLPTASGLIVSKFAVEANGGKFEATPPAFGGPYVIKEWSAGQRLILTVNPDWNGDKPSFDEVTIIPITDDSSAEISFEAGELDFSFSSVGAIPRYLAQAPEDASFVRKPSLGYVWMGLNMENPTLTNIKVRTAIQRAVNPAEAVEAAYFGAAESSTGIVAPGLIGHRSATLHGQNIEEAKQLLKEAGAEGLAVTMTFLNTQEFTSLAQTIQAQLALAGITATLAPTDEGSFWSLGDQIKNPDYNRLQLILNGFSSNPDPSFATTWFTPEQVGVWNWERWNSPEFGRMHKQGLEELDAAKRDEIYRKMQDLMEESGCYVFLTHRASGLLMRNTVTAAIRPDGIPLVPWFRRV